VAARFLLDRLTIYAYKVAERPTSRISTAPGKSDLMAAAIVVTHVEVSQPESATTLRTIVELVRRTLKADTVSILGFSMIDGTITWKAASGFTTDIDFSQAVFRPAGSAMGRRALEQKTVAILKGIGTQPELPAEEFPIHQAEGICDVAVAPMRIVGNHSGALVAGYRTSHDFTEDEQRLLLNLSEMAAMVLESERLVQSVKAAEKIWEKTFDAVAEKGIFVYNKEKRIVRCNARAAELLDLQIPEVIGLSFHDAFIRLFGQQAADHYQPEVRDAPSSFEVETDWGRRHIVSIVPIEDPDGEVFTVVTLRDVSRLAEMQEQLARSRRLGSVGQLAAGVAHEINNPLAAIATCAEAITRDLRKTEELMRLSQEHQWNYYLDEIVRQALRCKEITRGLLDLTQQRKAKRTLCDLNLIARDCAKLAVQGANSSAIEVQVRLDENLSRVATDAAMVRQIVDNLLSNAVDAIGDARGRITISTSAETDRAMIEVADNGPGIAADLLPRIFEPFISTKNPGKGYGLGLAICSALAESLGASLTVESKPGDGSKFRVWIPRREPQT
jgi:signal transduction histidine kinase